MIARSIFKITKRKLTLWLSIAVGVLVLSACSKPLPYPPTGNDPKLVILTQIGPLTFETPNGHQKSNSGFEHDLVSGFADSLNLKAEFITVAAESISHQLRQNIAHLGAAWLSPDDKGDFIASVPLYETRNVLVRLQKNEPLKDINNLNGLTINAVSGSHAANEAKQLIAAGGKFKLHEFKAGDALKLLEQVSNQEIEYAVVDRATYKIALNYFPNIESTLFFGKPYTINWLFPADTNPELIAQANAYLNSCHNNGTIKRLVDRYLGHIERLTPSDNAIFIERIQSLLPSLRQYFINAQEQTGIDWRLIAAVAYRESAWDSLATSPTNVRGIMMLTEDTAERLGVKDRLDAKQSILAGARYIQLLRRKIPNTTPEPDRTWQALASYNLGPTSYILARQFALKNGFNPNDWYDMKKALPKYAQVSHARGGEAVIMVESIRLLYDTLKRYEAPHMPKPSRNRAQPPKQVTKSMLQPKR